MRVQRLSAIPKTVLLLGLVTIIASALLVGMLVTEDSQAARGAPGPIARSLFSPEDLAAMTPKQLDERPLSLAPVERSLPTDRSWTTGVSQPGATSYVEYVIGARRVETDASLAPPVFVWPDSSGASTRRATPTVSLRPVETHEGEVVNYYFEFDTAPTFQTPNLWRWPILACRSLANGVTTRYGAQLQLLRTWQHSVDSTHHEVTFPFRVTAMRLPTEWDSLDHEEMVRHAKALGYGLSRDAITREVFHVVRHTMMHASDTVSRNAVDVFTRGLGECGATNEYAGALLELNGIRHRSVSGFNPRDRRLRGRVGGHTAIEVLHDGLERWSYFDPYLDFYFPDVGAGDFAEFAPAHESIIKRYRGDLEAYGPGVFLADLFAYRKYSDQIERLPGCNMLQVHGRENEYGLNWRLNVDETPMESEDLFPAVIRVYVRARYLVTPGAVAAYAREEADVRVSAKGARLSPWSTAHFDVDVMAALERRSAQNPRTRDDHARSSR